jgi:tape measure domain-containing protein
MSEKLSVEIDVSKASAALASVSAESGKTVSALAKLGNITGVTALSNALSSIKTAGLSQVSAGLAQLTSSINGLAPAPVNGIQASLSALGATNMGQVAQGVQAVGTAAQGLGSVSGQVQQLGAAMAALHVPVDTSAINFNKLSSQVKQSISEMSGMSSTSTQLASMFYQANFSLSALTEGFAKATGNSVELSRALLSVAALNMVKEIAQAAMGLVAPFLAASSAVNTFKAGLDSALGAGAGTKGFEDLRDIANSTGNSITGMSKNFQSFKISAEGANMTSEASSKTIKGFATAFGALGLSTSSQELSFKALSQMMSKGKITAEELKGQLGEQLPNAMGIFAKASGMSVAGFEAMLKSGNVVASELLPKVAAALQKDYAGGLEKALRQLPGQLSLFANSLFEVTAAFGNGNLIGILQPFANGLAYVNDQLKTEGFRAFVAVLGDLAGMLLNVVTVLVGSFVGGLMSAFRMMGDVARVVGEGFRLLGGYVMSLGQSVMALLSPWTEFGSALSNSSGFFGMLGSAISSVIGYIGTFAGVIAGFIATWVTVTYTISAATAAVGVLGSAIALLGGPLTLLVAGVGILVTGFVYLKGAAGKAAEAKSALAVATTTAEKATAIFTKGMTDFITKVTSGSGEIITLGESHRSYAQLSKDTAREIEAMEKAVSKNQTALKDNAREMREAGVRQREYMRDIQDATTAAKADVSAQRERAKEHAQIDKNLQSVIKSNEQHEKKTAAAGAAADKATQQYKNQSQALGTLAAGHGKGATEGDKFNAAMQRGGESLRQKGAHAAAANGKLADLAAGTNNTSGAMNGLTSSTNSTSPALKNAKAGVDALATAQREAVRGFEDSRSRNDSYRDSLGTMAERLKTIKEEFKDYGIKLDDSTRSLVGQLIAGGMAEKQAAEYAVTIARLLESEGERSAAGRNRIQQLQGETEGLAAATRGTTEGIAAERAFIEARYAAGELSKDEYKTMTKALDLRRDTIKIIDDERAAKLQEIAAIRTLDLWRQGGISMQEAGLRIAKEMIDSNEGTVNATKAASDATSKNTEQVKIGTNAATEMKTAKQKEAEAIKTAVAESKRATDEAKRSSEAVGETTPQLIKSAAAWGSLNTVLATLATSASTTSTAMESISTSVTTLANSLPQLPEPMTTVATNIRALGEQLVVTQPEMKRFAESVTTAATSLGAMAISMPLVNTAATAMVAPMGGVVEQFAKLLVDGPTIAKVFVDTGTGLTASASALPTVSKGLADVLAQIKLLVEVQVQFDAMVKSVGELGTSLDKLATSAAKNAEPIKNLATGLGEVGTAFDTGGTKIEEYGTKLDTLTEKIATLLQKLGELKTAAEEAAGAAGKAGGDAGDAGETAGNITAGAGRMGGMAGGLPQSTSVSGSAFSNAPALAAGTANTSKLVSQAVGGGGIPTILHPNEAVIPLSKGRSVPVELSGGQDNRMDDTAKLIAESVTAAGRNTAAASSPTLNVSPQEIFTSGRRGSGFGGTNAFSDNDVTSNTGPGDSKNRPLTVNITVNATDVDSFRRSKSQIQSEMYESLRRAHDRNN